MKIGERGQVTIPKRLREKYALDAHSEVEFVERQGELILRRKPRSRIEAARLARIRSSVGILGGSPADVDESIEEMRGR